jgi:hypothetical protein
MLFVDPGRNHGGLGRIRTEAPGLNQYLERVKRTIGIAELPQERPHGDPVEERVYRRLGSSHRQPFCQKDPSRVVEIGNKSDDCIGPMRGPVCVVLVNRELSGLRVPVHDLRCVWMGLIFELEIERFLEQLCLGIGETGSQENDVRILKIFHMKLA